MTTTYDRAVVLLDVVLEDFIGGPGVARSLLIYPRRVEVKSNSFREADEAIIEIDHDDLPIDPRMVRSARAAIHVGDAGSASGDLVIHGFDGEPDVDAMRRTLRFIGFVDLPQVSLSGAGESVRLELRDYTAPLLDAAWPGGSVDVARPLRDVLRDIVTSVPGMESLGDPGRIVIDEGAASTRPADLTGRSRFTPDADSSVWDVVVAICEVFALVPVFRLDTLYVRKAVDVAQTHATLRYGRDGSVARVELERRIQGGRQRQIRVVAWDEDARAQRVGVYPAQVPVTRRRVAADGSIKEERARVATYYRSGTYTVPQLTEIARRIYEDAQIREIEGSIETYDLTDEAGVDLLSLANGDRVTLLVDRDLARSVYGMSESELAAHIRASGLAEMDGPTANALAAAWVDANELATEFYVGSVRLLWSDDEGCRLDIRIQALL